MARTSITTTSLSLIARAKSLDKTAWERLTRLYTPLVYRWARMANVPEDDAADVVQEVFQAVAKSLLKFEPGPDLPPFRGWLWGIARHKIKDHFRRNAKQPTAAGGTDAYRRILDLPEQEPEESSDPWIITDQDSLAFRALELIQVDFAEKTWQAFWRVTIENQSPADVATDLGLAVGSVYTAKSRVLARLRSEFAGLF